MTRIINDHDYQQRFSGIGRLYGQQAMERLANSHVGIIGIGGVGTWTAEALARSGVGTLTLVDLDDICVTNTNRQLHALDGNIGRQKVDAMADRIVRINPSCTVYRVNDFFVPETADRIVTADMDFVVDAFDNFRNKCVLMDTCRAQGVPLVVLGGAGGRREPGRVRVADLTEASGDRLLAKVRKQLRQKHGWSRRGRWHVACVFSDEPQRYPTADGGVCEQRSEAASLTLDCASGFGTSTFVTGTFGFAAAAVVINALTTSPSDPEGAPPTPASPELS